MDRRRRFSVLDRDFLPRFVFWMIGFLEPLDQSIILEVGYRSFRRMQRPFFKFQDLGAIPSKLGV